MTAGLGTTNTKFIFISSQEGLGLSSAGVTEKQCPLPSTPSCWATAPWASWLSGPLSRAQLPRPRCGPCPVPTFGRGRQLLKGKVAAGSQPGRGPLWPMHSAQAS